MWGPQGPNPALRLQLVNLPWGWQCLKRCKQEDDPTKRYRDTGHKERGECSTSVSSGYMWCYFADVQLNIHFIFVYVVYICRCTYTCMGNQWIGRANCTCIFIFNTSTFYFHSFNEKIHSNFQIFQWKVEATEYKYVVNINAAKHTGKSNGRSVVLSYTATNPSSTCSSYHEEIIQIHEDEVSVGCPGTVNLCHAEPWSVVFCKYTYFIRWKTSCLLQQINLVMQAILSEQLSSSLYWLVCQLFAVTPRCLNLTQVIFLYNT